MSKILVIDDSPMDLTLVSTMLDDAGFDVTHAQSGLVGMKMAKSNPPDLILLDVNLPDINGIEVCRFFRAREQTKDIPVLFLSALNENDLKAASIEAGGSDFISKPYRQGILLSRVKAHLELAELKARMLLEDEKFYDTFNLAPIGIAQIGLEGNWLNANVHLLKTLGYSLTELRKHSLSDINPEHDLHDHITELVNETTHTFELNSQLLCKLGKAIKVNIKAKLVLNRHGHPHYSILIISES